MGQHYVVETLTSGGWTFERCCHTRQQAEQAAAECGDQHDEQGAVLAYGARARVRCVETPDGYTVLNGRLSRI